MYAVEFELRGISFDLAPSCTEDGTCVQRQMIKVINRSGLSGLHSCCCNNYRRSQRKVAKTLGGGYPVNSRRIGLVHWCSRRGTEGRCRATQYGGTSPTYDIGTLEDGHQSGSRLLGSSTSAVLRKVDSGNTCCQSIASAARTCAGLHRPGVAFPPDR